MSLLYDWEWDLGVAWVVGEVVESGCGDGLGLGSREGGQGFVQGAMLIYVLPVKSCWV